MLPEGSGMFMTTSLAAIFIVIKLLIGSVIGVVAAALIQRSHLRFGLAVRGACFGGVAFLIASGIAGWAGLHAEFNNGQRMDLTSSGEDLWLRNRIVENELVICIASSAIAGILAGGGLRSVRRPG
jgi:hypothetical protein